MIAITNPFAEIVACFLCCCRCVATQRAKSVLVHVVSCECCTPFGFLHPPCTWTIVLSGSMTMPAAKQLLSLSTLFNSLRTLRFGFCFLAKTLLCVCFFLFHFLFCFLIFVFLLCNFVFIFVVSFLVLKNCNACAVSDFRNNFVPLFLIVFYYLWNCCLLICVCCWQFGFEVFVKCWWVIWDYGMNMYPMSKYSIPIYVLHV